MKNKNYLGQNKQTEGRAQEKEQESYTQDPL